MYGKKGKDNPSYGQKRPNMSKFMSERNKRDNPVYKPGVKDKIRQTILELYERGELKNSNTSIEIIMKSILEKLKIDYVHQKKFGFWVFDFYLPKYDIFIECDGDYWHSNPKFYSNDQLNETQKNNLKRGKAKNTFTKNKNKILLRFWEYDLNNNKDMIIKNLQKVITGDK